MDRMSWIDRMIEEGTSRFSLHHPVHLVNPVENSYLHRDQKNGQDEQD
jgi:hypothetical protein